MIQEVPENLVKHSSKHAEYLMTRYTSDKAIIGDLVARGMNKEGATTVVAYIAEKREKQKLEQSKKSMISGAVWFIVGILIMATSFSSSSVGGAYFISGGAIIYGAIQFVQGFVQRSPTRR